MSGDSTSAEVFRPIPGFPGYDIGDHGTPRTYWRNNGRLKSTIGDTPRPLSPGVGTRGYLHVTLYRDGKPRIRKVHQIVLEAFRGPCPPGHECAHENRIPGDCRLVNLAWKTKIENAEDKRRHGTIVSGENVNTAKLNPQKVREIRDKYSNRPREYGELFLEKLVEEYGVSRASIWKAAMGITWKGVASA